MLKPERVYLVLGSLFGLTFLVLTPPFQVPDEDNHFYRSVEISEGHLVARKKGNYTGDEVPAAVKALVTRYAPLAMTADQKTTVRDVLESAEIRDHAGERVFAGFSNTAIHTPLAYLPQAAAIGLARLFSPCVLVWFYAGRLFNLLAATAVTFLAIRMTPVGKWSFTALALTPMALFESASLSADALTNAIAFLLVAQVLAYAFSPVERVGAWAILRLALSGVAIGLAKQAYFLLPLCYALIPVRVMGGRRRWWVVFGVFLGATFLAVCGWALVVRNIYSPADPQKGLDPAAQILLIRTHPLEFVYTVGRTAALWRMFAEEYVGWLGTLDVRLPVWLHFAEYAFLIVVFLGDYDPRKALTVGQALIAASVALIVGFTLLVIIYITWDKPGNLQISLQGRYFIPIGPLAAVAITRLGSLIPPVIIHKTSSTVSVAAVVLVPIFLFTAYDRVYDRFFVDSPERAARRAIQHRYADAVNLQKEHGSDERVRELYEAVLTLDPDHVKAHLQLGLLLLNSDPAAAAKHFRAVVRLDPRNVVALNDLANILMGRLEYAEAAQLYQDALTVSPEVPGLRETLNDARQRQRGLEKALQQASSAFRSVLTPDVLEKRHAGTAQEGLYLKPARGRVVDAAGRSPVPDPYVWRSPPPSGEEIVITGPNGGRHHPFYACCAVAAGIKRAFVFAPAEVVLLADDEVSWYFQVPLDRLTAAEREQEQSYRRQQNIRFPLVALPK
jgi:uncharacterized membrane protein